MAENTGLGGEMLNFFELLLALEFSQAFECIK